MYSAQRALNNDAGVAAERRADAEARIAEAQAALDRWDVEAVRNAIADLTMVVHDLQNKYRTAPESSVTSQLPIIDDADVSTPEPATSKRMSLRDLLKRGRE
jgi:hypothetical protein